MQHKTVPIQGIKTADLPEGTFEGWGAVFDNVDSQGDIIRRGAFTKSLGSGQVTPLIWQHQTGDPRSFVGEVVKAAETAEGLHITGRFDLDTEHGAAAYRAVKARRVTGLSIGYAVRDATKNAAGVTELLDLDLAEISVVTRPANERALIGAVKSAPHLDTLRTRVATAQHQAKQGVTPMTTKTDAVAQRDEHLAKARQIVDVAAELDRELTTEESDLIEKHLTDADQLSKTIEAHTKSADILARLNAMAPRDTDLRPDGASPAPGKPGDGQRLTFGKGMAAGLTAKILGDTGTKALAPSGATVVNQEFKPDPVALGKPALSLLDLLPVVQHTTQEFAYLRQTVRTNNAAVVAAGDVKPTSVYSVERVEDSLDVIAHLSEGVPRYWFADNSSLQQFLANELQYGLQQAVEAMVLDAVDAATPQSQGYDTSPLATLRKAITKLEVAGHTPAAIVVHPEDWEGIELALSSTNAVEHMSLPYDAATRRLFGVPVAVSIAEDEGVAHLFASGAVALDTDTLGVAVQWSENSNADDWSRNLIRARCEGRYATSVYAPLGVVAAAIAGGS